MIEFSKKTHQADETQTSTFRRFLTQIQPYQNIIFFILLIISLAILLIIWRSYRISSQAEEAWVRLNNPRTSQELQGLRQQYTSVAEIQPLICYRLVIAYYREEQYQEAKKQCQRFFRDYPEHVFRPRIETLLENIEANIKWQAEDKPKELKKLKELRNFPLATVKTKKGEFQIELYEEDAPNTVANFITLAEKKAYNHTPFYEMNTKLGLLYLGIKEDNPPSYTLPFEINSLKNSAGSVGMIRDLDSEIRNGHPERKEFLNSASSRFYISLRNNPAIDGKYTIFGRVGKGMDVVGKLKKNDEITEIVINHKRNHSYKPTVIEMK